MALIHATTAPLAILCLAGAALGQDLAIYEHTQVCTAPDLSTTPALAVGQQIVVAGSHRMMLYNKFPLVTPFTIPLDERPRVRRFRSRRP